MATWAQKAMLGLSQTKPPLAEIVLSSLMAGPRRWWRRGLARIMFAKANIEKRPESVNVIFMLGGIEKIESYIRKLDGRLDLNLTGRRALYRRRE
jgi:hypothetical protein